MRIVVDSSPAEWLSYASPLLRRAEAENNLLLGLAAQAAADAAKEGGFMGFGGQQVSEREQAMLDRVRTAVSS